MALNHRQMLQTGLAARAAATTVPVWAPSAAETEKAAFNLAYAPHFGMFGNAAGKDEIDQLKSAADPGFDGIVGMEHGNSKPGKDGDMAVIQAYRDVDAF